MCCLIRDGDADSAFLPSYAGGQMLGAQDMLKVGWFLNRAGLHPGFLKQEMLAHICLLVVEIISVG